MRRHIVALCLGVVVAVLWTSARAARACGCLSPPAVSEGEYAVNQRAEQIIFEVEPGWVTAHVLIKYAGAPDKFAWIVPVPEVPELAISPASAFGILDKQTAPVVGVETEDICPISEWQCRYHEQPSCGRADTYGAGDNGAYDAGFNADAASGMPPVTVLDEQTVGDYQTVTFRASEAAAAVQWLRDNGFIVNPTTSIYMESYIQQNMVFVAAKLVPGAGVASIKPLRMKYRAAFPMVPLVLTAVAAEPHLTVTAFVYGSKPFRPQGHPIVSIASERIAQSPDGRVNYPMALARAIDEAGGDGFAVEYRGTPVRADFGTGACCDNELDICRLGGDTKCQCPRSAFDHDDCAAVGDLVDGVALLDELSGRYPALTRITTRVSAEEMKFDPQFEPDYDAALGGRLVVRGSQPSLARCAADVIDRGAYDKLEALQGCAAVYCGTGGAECAATEAGAGCTCAQEQVALRFVDLDGRDSVTCVPKVPPVDLRAGGLQLPDACANVSCGLGTCRDRNGVAVCECEPGAAAVATTGAAPRCERIGQHAGSPGAQDYSEGLRELAVCAPQPPVCGPYGWLVRTASPRPGVACDNTEPAERLTQEPPKPTCGGFFGCGCQEGASDAHPLAIAAAGLLFAVLVRKRRRVAVRP